MKSDLAIFRDEVLSKGAEACLPANLTDLWLLVLLKEATDLHKGIEKNKNDSLSAACIRLLLFEKSGNENLKLSDVEMESYINLYLSELAVEEISRKTTLKYLKASIGSILEERDLGIEE